MGSVAKITSKGQITIPKDIRALLNLESGDKVNFIVTANNAVNLIPVTKDIRTLKGIVPAPDTPVTLDDMEKAIKSRGGKL